MGVIAYGGQWLIVVIDSDNSVDSDNCGAVIVPGMAVLIVVFICISDSGY